MNEADAWRVQAAWNNRDATGTELHTLLQAGLVYADAGMHHARRLADQWRGFYTACTQGEGKRLGPSLPRAAKPGSPLEPGAATTSEPRRQTKDTEVVAKKGSKTKWHRFTRHTYARNNAARNIIRHSSAAGADVT